MQISELARRAGIRPSAIRYYESIGLLPPPHRVSGRRQYGADTLDYLVLIRFGLRTGFSLQELRSLFAAFGSRSAKSKLAQGKLQELRQLRARVELVERMLRQLRLCRCATVRDCSKRLLRSDAWRELLPLKPRTFLQR